MSQNFKYTKSFESWSSLVDGVYYNEDTQECVVDLDDSLYRYSNVPVSAFNDFEEAGSHGRHYNLTFKRTYGPGEFLGCYDDVDLERVNVIMPVSPDRANAPSRPSYYVANNTYYGNGTGGTPVVSNNRGAGMPKALVDAVTSPHISLTAPNEDSTVRKHAVTFEVEGQAKTHTLRATSVGEAVDSVTDIGNMLGLTFVVKEVTVYFD